MQDAEKFKATDAKKFHYLNQSKCFELTGINDSKEYARTRRAMDIVGINLEEQVLYVAFKIENLQIRAVLCVLLLCVSYCYFHFQAGCYIQDFGSYSSFGKY